jgi:hypothetical protein
MRLLNGLAIGTVLAAVVGPLAVAGDAPDIPAAATLADRNWAAVRGRIVWPARDKVPEVRRQEIQGPAGIHVTIEDETWLVHPTNRGIRNVIVWVDSPDARTRLPVHPLRKPVCPKEVVIEQRAFSYRPHVLVLREGQALTVVNTDRAGNNFRWVSHPLRNPAGNVAVPPRQSQTLRQFRADSRFPILVGSDVCPWMTAFIWVFDHPHHAVTDADGCFEIPLAPIGECKLMIWHETGFHGGPVGYRGSKLQVTSPVTDLGRIEWKP